MATSLKRNSMTRAWSHPLAAKPACAQRAALSGCNSQSAAAAYAAVVSATAGGLATVEQHRDLGAASITAPAACSAAMMSR
jgi:hypothetical protein